MTASTDVSLPLWRLLDWRFLLPAAPAGVLLLGGARAGDPRLRAALDLLPDLLVRTDPGPADLLYLVDPDHAELARLLPSLRPGGLLYAEVSRRGRVTPHTWRQRVTRAGLVEVEVHWHAPDFASRTRIVPVDDRAAVQDTVGRHDGAPGSRVQAGVALLLQRAGALDRILPHASVLARR